MPKPKGNWVNFQVLQAVAEEAMLEERFAIENHGKMREEVCLKFVKTFDPEVVHNLIELLESFAELLCDYRGTHVDCDNRDGVENRCVICHKLEKGGFNNGAFVNVIRVDKDGNPI